MSFTAKVSRGRSFTLEHPVELQTLTVESSVDPYAEQFVKLWINFSLGEPDIDPLTGNLNDSRINK